MRRGTFSTAIACATGLVATGCFFAPSGSLDSAAETEPDSTGPAVTATTDAPGSCGDRVVDDGEECDVGPEGNGACTDRCTLDVCGDGYVGNGEGCDDGNAIAGDGCTPACTLESCGDGVVQAGEACDDGNDSPNDACTTLCTAPTCGDGFVQAGVEACDDGNLDDDDACTAACEPARCGDGHLGPGEGCDDGNDSDLDACLTTCTPSSCGDGFLQEELGEACDEGEDNSDQGACTSACVWGFCGDGLVLEGVEACDDGNAANDDGCLDSCAAAACGDGFVGPDEDCDHGEKNGLGVCDASCVRVAHAVFVTAKQFKPGIDFTSADEADALCDEAASALGVAGTFRAWIGSELGDPAGSFHKSKLPYRMFNKNTPIEVAKSWTDLVDGALLKPINLTELGTNVGGAIDCDPIARVWTGVASSGIYSGYDCFKWASASVEYHGTVGSARSATLWSDAMCMPTCDAAARLYCIEQ